jgi:hypothetical protein
MMEKLYPMCKCNKFAFWATELQKGIPEEKNMQAEAPLRVPLTWSDGKGILSISWNWCTDSVDTHSALGSCGIV